MAKGQKGPRPESLEQPRWENRIVGTDVVDAKELLANPKNYRLHSAEQRAALTNVLDKIGWVQNVVCNQRDGKRILIDGHLRCEMAAERGERVPVSYVSMTEAEEAVILAAFDRLTQMAGFDEAKWQALVAESIAAFPDMEATFQSINLTLDGPGMETANDGLTDPDETPEPPAEPVSRAGDLWIMGGHRLLVGDSTKAEHVERLMDGEKARICVTSPPYNQGIDGFKPSGMHKEGDWVAKVGRLAYPDSLPEPEYQAQQRGILELLYGAMADGASLFYNHKNRYRDKRVITPLAWIPGPFALRQEIIWSRPGSVTQNARMFLPSDERVYWMYKGNNFYFDDSTEIKTWSTVWEVALETNKSHAVAFPRELPRRCIRACSMPADIVLEPYAGSGSTLIAAEMTGRRCYGIEIDPANCDTIVVRWQNFTGKLATLESTGQTFAEVAAMRNGVAA